MSFTKLLEKLPLNSSLTLKNRIMMSAMARNRGIVPQEITVDYYTQRASAGLIITEGVLVEEQAGEWRNAPGIYSADQVKAWKKVTDSVHAKDGLIFAQLWHLGRVSHHLHNPRNALPVAPSAIKAKGGNILTDDDGTVSYETPRALTVEEIKEKVEVYRAAAVNAKEAGFDGVELHAAYGYLPNQFLLDGSNQRDDEYGGSIENRARFIFEILDQLVLVWGSDRVGIKLSPSNTYNDTFDSNPREVYTYVLEKMNDYNLAYVTLVGGTEEDERHGATLIPAKEFRKIYHGNLFLNNSYTVETASEALENNFADGISFGRYFITNPDLVERIALGKPLTQLTDYSKLYHGGASGYTDYPTWDQRSPEVAL